MFNLKTKNDGMDPTDSNKSSDNALAAYVWDNNLQKRPPPNVTWRIVGQRNSVAPNGICSITSPTHLMLELRFNSGARIGTKYTVKLLDLTTAP